MSNAGEETKDMQQGKNKPLPIGWFALFTPSDAMPKDRGLYAKRRGIIIAAGLVITAICWGLGQSSDFVESVYAAHLTHPISRGLAAVSGLLVTSVAEALVIIFAAWFLFLWLRACVHVIRRKRRALNAVAGGALHLGAFASVVAATFFVLWGLNYSRPPLPERMNWEAHTEPPSDRQAQADELYHLADYLVESTNVAYNTAMGAPDYGTPSAPAGDWVALNAAIDQGFEVLAEDLRFEAGFEKPRGLAKPMTLSALMNYLHIGGFYFPWTGEANFSRLQPGCVLPFVIAHEKAHQRGVASEDEANFIGFAACIRSDDPYVRYSGYLFAQRQILGALMRVDAERGTELLRQRLPGVQRDVDDMHGFWETYTKGVAGVTGEVSRVVNDTYLKANRVEGGVENYGMSTQLIIVYYRATAR
jgi:hypothetical protein